MNKNHFLILLFTIFVVFSCKKEDEPDEPTPNPEIIEILAAINNVSCFGESDGSIFISVSGGSEPYSYFWSTGSTNENISGLSADTYIVNVLDSQGNRGADTFLVSQPDAMFITEEYLPDVLDITVYGGTPPYTYLWSTGATTEDLANYDYTPCSVVVTDAGNCVITKSFSPIILEDGLYIFGNACGNVGLHADNKMQTAKNEVTQEIRDELYELYIPLKAGTSGFNIVDVNGTEHTTYGPHSNWGIVTNPDIDEPKDVPIQRGSVVVSTEAFNIEEDGLYHIVIDREVMIAVVCQAEWGIIGGATPQGWSTSTSMDESTYDPTNMSWEITDTELNGGDWKLRYSNGWKLIVDPDYNIGGGISGIKVNANMGGTITDLIPGGDNIVNSDPGMYTISLNYVLGQGYTAEAIKTGELPYTNWTGVVCDAVGTGISSDNPNAIPDPSGWGWGNKLLADNGGIPSISGSTTYTWTWEGIILEAYEGFKVRTENGETPPSGGANFDAGYNELNISASSSHVIDDGGNLMVDVKGSYFIMLEIDAANGDVKNLVVTEY